MSRQFHRIARGVVGVVTALLLTGTAAFAADYPSHPVRMIIPFGPGGSTDLVGRFIAPVFEQKTGQRLIIENKGGADSIIGTMEVVHAKPDGYTILLTSSSYVVNSVTHASIPYAPFKDLVPVSLLASGPLVLVVHKSLGVTTVPGLIAYLKAHPGEVPYASGGSGSPPHLGAELFSMVTGTKMIHVPYKGSGPAATAVAGGQVKLMFAGFSEAQPFVKSGQLIPLAITSPKRSVAYPGVPTLTELGLGKVDAGTYWGVLAPRGTPPEIVNELSKDLAAYVNAPEVRSKLEALGYETIGTTPEAYDKEMHAEVDRWGPVVKAIGLQVK